MSIALSPIVSEFETEEQAASHDHWFRTKVQASRDDPRPSVPHDQAMARIRKKLAGKLANQQETTAGKDSCDN
ncbi:stability determinant [Pusillimonas sp. SM2304]|uniref:type II toxin-antitoxin system RelB family antitoxin n=1 Tax=Pusillimonas sp. SM2304 TaxID=3073241 RepID=UPI0028769E09|nr:stability determinant [Pusillimonas sp. SM2304]MDS1140015.1 stability determinant [Pusillimonas sp. SM2304]